MLEHVRSTQKQVGLHLLKHLQQDKHYRRVPAH
jgi:hypothetical protein